MKVYLPDGKTLSCSAKAEVGADGIVAVPVTVWRSVKGVYESLGEEGEVPVVPKDG